MSIASDMIRGHTETIILARLSHGDSYGYQINKDMMEATHNKMEFKEATLYTAFRRLEQNGLIVSRWGNEEVGARRRYYTLTQAGLEALEANRLEWEEMKQTIDLLIK